MKDTRSKSMIVAGIMSGTSADGVDVAIVRITPALSQTRLKLLAHEGFPFPAPLRQAILAAMNAESISTSQLARLHARLGIAYAEAVEKTLRKHALHVDLIGCHGQTLFHQPNPTSFLGKRFACTWQLGEPAVLAEKLQTPVISNFRPADIAVGGQGAPLVPFLDYTLFAHAHRNRVLQNIGGIANLTAIPAASTPADIVAFDNGPGNMILDWLAQELFSIAYDKNGRIAASGKVLGSVLQAALRHSFFRKHPPRTAGREEFGREFAADFLAQCKRISKREEDAMATATAFTAESIAQSYERFAHPSMRSDNSSRCKVDYIVSGGGARNATLMNLLQERLKPLGCELTTSESFGLPAEAKEAAAFALLAYQTWNHLPSNIPAATGAKRPVILGQVNYV